MVLKSVLRRFCSVLGLFLVCGQGCDAWLVFANITRSKSDRKKLFWPTFTTEPQKDQLLTRMWFMNINGFYSCTTTLHSSFVSLNEILNDKYGQYKLLVDS